MERAPDGPAVPSVAHDEQAILRGEGEEQAQDGGAARPPAHGQDSEGFNVMRISMLKCGYIRSEFRLG